MPTLKTMRVGLRPAEKTDYGYRMRLGIGRDVAGVSNFEFEVSTPDEMEAKLAEILANAEPEYGTEAFPNNAWYVSISPASGRWAPGWKARFDDSRVVRYDEVTA